MVSYMTYLKVTNGIDKPIKTQVYNVDPTDWRSSSRPDINFQNRPIEPDYSLTQVEMIRADAVSTYTLLLICGEIELVTCRINQTTAHTGEGHQIVTPSITYNAIIDIVGPTIQVKVVKV